MIKFKSTTGLIGILIASTLVTSCDYGKGGLGKESKKEEETKKLVDEQKKLVDEEKKLVDEEKKLVKDFNKKYNLTPEQTKKFDESLNKLKNKNSVEELDTTIKGLKEFETLMSPFLKIIEQADKTNNPNEKKAFLKEFNKGFSEIASGYTEATTVDEAKIALLDFINQGLKQNADFQLTDLNQLIPLFSDYNLILENLKKQGELK